MSVQASSTSVLNTDPTVKLLVLGGGYSGGRLAATAARQGIRGLLSHRNPGQAAAAPPGWRTIGFDAATGLQPEADDLAGVTHVISTIPPGSDGQDPVLHQLLTVLLQLNLHWVGYLSTTGVYGDSGGAWVDEGTPCRPRAGRSQARLSCEQAWHASGLPLQIFRLPAIYGPGRNPFADLLAGRSRLLHRPGQVFCRVHVDDICGALLHCLALPTQQRPAIVNVCDDLPCSSAEQLGYAAHLVGCKLPDVQRFDAIASSMSPMARSFWLENRRVSNALLCTQLGYRLRYPNYRAGLRASLLEEGAATAPQPASDASGSAT